MTKTGHDSSSPVWHLRVAYHGGGYCGWQIQPRDPTVQQELEFRLRRLFHHEELKISATSRTDTGVHALDQNVSFPVPELSASSISPERLRRLLNRWLPADIRVTAAMLRPPGFHARYSALAKAYTYVIESGENHSPFSAPFAWQMPAELNLLRMREAAAIMTGTHDFAGFSANPRRQLDSTVREIYRFEVLAREQMVYLNVIGNGFLYKMVRSLAGYLVEAGEDDGWKPDECRQILAHGKRTARVRTAPPQGLFLARVFFSSDEQSGYSPRLPPYNPE